MNSTVRISLKTTPQQAQRLLALQQAFAKVCNTLAPMVQQTRCWNRVALHHMAYKQLREQFPGLGSQMVCNAIYSVSRTSRIVYQHPKSPFNVARWGDKPLARLQFLPEAPVYFDRHTLSIKDGQISMFTLDGRMRFKLDLSPENEIRFRQEKLREIVLSSKAEEFMLSFHFSPTDGEPEVTEPSSPNLAEYVIVMDADRPHASPQTAQHNAPITP